MNNMDSRWIVDFFRVNDGALSPRTIAVVSTLGVALALPFILFKKPKHPHPPGPTPLPIVGNLFDIPLKESWKTYNEWSKQYGDIMYLSALGTRIVVLNSLASANALLTQQAPTFSDRAFSPVIDLMRVQSWSFAIMNYGQLWRDHRRVFHQFLNQSQVHKYHPIIEEEMTRLMHKLLLDPKDFQLHARYALGVGIMRIMYGAEDPAYNQQLVEVAEVLVGGFTEYSAPGRLLVNILPALQYVPSWFPGAGWKRKLLDLADLADDTLMRPWADAKVHLTKGNRVGHVPGMAPQLIQQLPQEATEESRYQEEVGRGVCAQAYVAGADTTVSSAIALFLALAMHPDVQRKAQEELDGIIGTVRIPTFKDIQHLPYIQAILKETSRWHSVVPLSLPHMAAEDTIFDGYFIPAKTIILPNTWAIMHDPAVFEDPMSFKPERYLTADGKLDDTVLDPESAAFGYGRRICPGRHLSNDALILLLASLLACYEIKPAIGKDGLPIPLELKVDSGSLVSAPSAFEVSIVPRSEQHAAMIVSLGDAL